MDKYINQIICGDCKEVMSEMPENSVDTIITDPPYGLEFMGKKWDYDIPSIEVWIECLRVAKPGATMLCFGGTRTYHRIACGIEDAGWILKDCIMWIYGSGFPKATDISKQLDKNAGAEREVIGKQYRPEGRQFAEGMSGFAKGEVDITAPTTEQAKLWNGWKSHGLKPAYEPIIIAVKPNDGSYANNALKWGVAGLNIDGGRVQTEENTGRPQYKSKGWKNTSGMTGSIDDNWKKGRYPANVIHDGSDEVLKGFPNSKDGIAVRRNVGHSISGNINYATGSKDAEMKDDIGYGGSGSAARFFYCAKASKAERNKGCEDMFWLDSKRISEELYRKLEAENEAHKDDKEWKRHNIQWGNIHPTVKSLSLMEYLCTITKTPTGGIVLDPFLGSGTTAMACIKTGRNFIGIEKDPEYCKIAQKRIDATEKPLF